MVTRPMIPPPPLFNPGSESHLLHSVPVSESKLLWLRSGPQNNSEAAPHPPAEGQLAANDFHFLSCASFKNAFVFLIMHHVEEKEKSKKKVLKAGFTSPLDKEKIYIYI